MYNSLKSSSRITLLQTYFHLSSPHSCPHCVKHIRPHTTITRHFRTRYRQTTLTLIHGDYRVRRCPKILCLYVITRYPIPTFHTIQKLYSQKTHHVPYHQLPEYVAFIIIRKHRLWITASSLKLSFPQFRSPNSFLHCILHISRTKVFVSSSSEHTKQTNPRQIRIRKCFHRTRCFTCPEISYPISSHDSQFTTKSSGFRKNAACFTSRSQSKCWKYVVLIIIRSLT
jgi:hypothetical protein